MPEYSAPPHQPILPAATPATAGHAGVVHATPAATPVSDPAAPPALPAIGPDEVALVIDGRPAVAKKGTTVLQAAEKTGILVPHYCYHPGLSIAGNCRMCLVEIEKMPKLQIGCATTVAPGMVVKTSNERVRVVR